MPLIPTLALFVVALAFFAAGSPLGVIPLVLGVISISLKLGMPVVTEDQPVYARNAKRDRQRTI